MYLKRHAESICMHIVMCVCLRVVCVRVMRRCGAAFRAQTFLSQINWHFNFGFFFKKCHILQSLAKKAQHIEHIFAAIEPSISFYTCMYFKNVPEQNMIDCKSAHTHTYTHEHVHIYEYAPNEFSCFHAFRANVHTSNAIIYKYLKMFSTFFYLEYFEFNFHMNLF